MKNTNRQISPSTGRSTKKKNAGLSLLRPKLFTVVGDTYKYFNEVFRNISQSISKSISFSLSRLTQKKFKDFDIFSFRAGHYSFSYTPKISFGYCSWLIDPIHRSVDFTRISRY